MLEEPNCRLKCGRLWGRPPSATKSIACFLTLSVSCISVTACGPDPLVERGDANVAAPIERFLSFYFNEYQRGLPDESQLADLSSILTPKLLSLLEAAIMGEECYLEKIDYEGPGPMQGDLFSSLFEGATSATYRPIAQEEDAATFEVEWTHDSPLAADPFVWTDQIILVETADGWRIADFAHLGTWEFMAKGDVSQILRAISEECAV